MALLSGVRHPVTNQARKSRNKRRAQSRLSEYRGETESEAREGAKELYPWPVHRYQSPRSLRPQQ